MHNSYIYLSYCYIVVDSILIGSTVLLIIFLIQIYNSIEFLNFSGITELVSTSTMILMNK